MKKTFEQFRGFEIDSNQCKKIKGGIYCYVDIVVYENGRASTMRVGGSCGSGSMNDCQQYADNLESMYNSMGEDTMGSGCNME